MFKPSILLIEDDDTIRESLREILELENYQIFEAENGKVGLECLKSIEAESRPLPAAILLDINMPIMTGPEFLVARKQESPAIAQVPVIITTAAPDAHDMGTAGFLRKPIDLDDLLDRLSVLARRSRNA